MLTLQLQADLLSNLKYIVYATNRNIILFIVPQFDMFTKIYILTRLVACFVFYKK